MIVLNPIFLLIALPSWLVSLYLLRRLKKVRQAAQEPAPATVTIEE